MIPLLPYLITSTQIKMQSHISSHILIHDISDHLPIVTITKNTKPLKQFCNKYKRDTKYFVAEEFLIDLDQGWLTFFPKPPILLKSSSYPQTNGRLQNFIVKPS